MDPQAAGFDRALHEKGVILAVINVQNHGVE
jgi:hypothetical protein